MEAKALLAVSCAAALLAACVHDNWKPADYGMDRYRDLSSQYLADALNAIATRDDLRIRLSGRALEESPVQLPNLMNLPVSDPYWVCTITERNAVAEILKTMSRLTIGGPESSGFDATLEIDVYSGERLMLRAIFTDAGTQEPPGSGHYVTPGFINGRTALLDRAPVDQLLRYEREAYRKSLPCTD